jgi:DNA-binding LytR/AlgR family response regulator
LTCVGEFPNPLEALDFLHTETVDLVFLDIQMPKMNGLDFIPSLPKQCSVIITSAYPNFALKGFELNVTDYLTKPISLARFSIAMNKVMDKHSRIAPEPVTPDDFFFVKCDQKYEKIKYADLMYVEALQNYVVLQTIKKRIIGYLTFKSVEEFLPKAMFLKVHKSFIVSLAHIDQFDQQEISIGDKKIPISRMLKDEIVRELLQNKLLKR